MMQFKLRPGVLAIGVLVAALTACGGGGDDDGPAPEPTPSPSPTPTPTPTPTPGAVEITAQPQATTAALGQSATFSVSVSGDGPFSYQWQRNGVDIVSATAATYVTPPLTAADQGALFSVTVTSPSGSSVASAQAELTVQSSPGPTPTPVPPSITSQPQAVTVQAGQPASFSVAASGTGPLAYQWRRNGVEISGATAATYATPPVTVADDGAAYTVAVTGASGQVAISAEARLTVQAGSGLEGRSWTSGQQLETGDVSVRLTAVEVDDAGNAIGLFTKRENGVDVLYAVRGSQGAWAAPVVINQDAGQFLSVRDFTGVVLKVAPGGNAVAVWASENACTEQTYYPSGKCWYIYRSQFNAASQAWSAPERLVDSALTNFDSSLADVKFNDRGDFAMSYRSWERRPGSTSLYDNRRGVLWQAAGQSQLHKATFPEFNRSALGMDKNGNLLLVAELGQNSTDDIVVYRGSTTSGLGAQEVVDQRSASASLLSFDMGLNGQAAAVWQQNNGAQITRFVATLTEPTAAWSIHELESASSSSPAVAVTDGGQALVYNFSGCYRHQWADGVWSSKQTLPGCYFDTRAYFNRNGDYLVIGNNGGRWGSYDASGNRFVQQYGDNSTIFGVLASLGSTVQASLSVRGVAALTSRAVYDTLPSPAQPSGDGRNSVYNLWGFFLQ